jgi:capsular polysaccharide biosynthesis protein/Mrp family chromosome partitioning ATPase
LNAVERYLYHLRRWWWMVLVVAGITGVLSYMIASATSGSYSATTTLLINVDSGSRLDDDVAAERLARTYALLIKTNPIMEASADRLGGPETADELESQVTATPVAGTQLLEISASADDAARSAEISNAVAAVFVEQVAAQQVLPSPSPAPGEESTTPTRPQVVLSVVEPATVPGSTSGAPVPVQTFAGIVAGASLVLIVLAGRAYFDSSVWNPEDLRAAGLKLPCLGIIPDGELGGASLLSSGRAMPALTEASRTVATTALSRLKHSADNGCQAVGVVSSVRREGRTSVTARLGVAAALEGMGITLVDFDLRNPHLHEEFRVPISPGITEAMWTAAGRVPTLDETATAVLDHLRIVPAGQDPSLPARRLSTAEVANAVDTLKSNGTQVMFFDTPPLSEGTEAVVLGQVLDAAIVVVEARKTTVEEVINVSEQMEALGLDVLGYVLNKR